MWRCAFGFDIIPILLSAIFSICELCHCSVSQFHIYYIVCALSATPLIIPYLNVYFIVWRCACGFDIIVCLVFYESTNGRHAVFFVNPRRSRRDIVLASSVCPSIPPVCPHFLSVLNNILVSIGQIWFILGTNDKYHGLSISYKFRQNRPLNTWVFALVLV